MASALRHRLFSDSGCQQPQSRLMQEIRAAPISVGYTLQHQSFAASKFASLLKKSSGLVPIIACGSSMNAAEIGSSAFHPATFRLVRQPRANGSWHRLALFISQSGNTADVVLPFREAGERGVFRVAITNERQSELGSGAEHLVPTCAQKEESVPATGTMLAAAATLFNVGARLAGDSQALDALHSLPERIVRLIESAASGDFAAIVEGLRKAGYVMFLGERALSHVASEAALKMKETAEIISEARGAREARHGYLSAFGSRAPEIAGMQKAVVLFAEGCDREAVQLYESISRDKGFPLFVVAVGEKFDFGYSMRIPAAGMAERALLPIVFSQMLAHDISALRGLEPGTSEVNSKVVR